MSRSIILIYPCAGQDVLGINVGLPLSVIYVGTSLKNAGFNVMILDERVTEDPRNSLEKMMRLDPLFVGISSMTGYQIGHGLGMAREIRNLNPDVPIVWGGVHPTIYPDSTVQNAFVDIVVIGEGEETTVELARSLERGRELNDVKGIVYKDDGKIVRTPRRSKLDLERLPRPEYSLVDVKRYFTIGHISRTNQLQIVTSRGCPFHCSYCYLLLPALRGYRTISAQKVYDEIKQLTETYEVRSIFFYDDYFFADRQRVAELVELLEANPLDVQFEVPCRVDFLARESDEFLARMRNVGFTELLLGVESGSDRILKLIRKGITREQIIRANHKLANARISSKMSWMAGFPTETEAEFFETVDLMLLLKAQNPYCSLTPLGIYTPYPGTELYETCKDQFGIVFPESLEGWADYQWQKNNNSYLGHRRFDLLTKLNVSSRFFDHKLFQRFGQKDHKPVIMGLFYLYSLVIRSRVRLRFFRLMPEIRFLDWLQNLYITSTHKKYRKLKI